MEAKTEPGEFNYRWPFYPVISKKLSPKRREGVVSGFSPRDKLHGREHGVPLLAHVRYIKIITCLRDFPQKLLYLVWVYMCLNQVYGNKDNFETNSILPGRPFSHVRTLLYCTESELLFCILTGCPHSQAP